MISKKEETTVFTEKEILKIVNTAVDLAADDTGLEECNYGMLEERIQYYVNVDMFERGLEIVVVLDRETFIAKVIEVLPVVMA